MDSVVPWFYSKFSDGVICNTAIMVDKVEEDTEVEDVGAADREKHKEVLTDIIKTCKQMETSMDVFIDKLNSGPDTSKGISFLDLKNDLMIDYNLNLIYLMYKKSCKGKIENDKAVERLCYLRTVLEKIRPIEHKLKYQIDKCVSVAETGHIDSKDPSRFKANPDLLASKFEDNDQEDDSEEEEGEDDDKDKGGKKYVAPKNVPAFFDGDKTKEELESEMQVKKKKAALSHSMMRELQQQLYDTPEEISHQADVKKQKYISREREKELYEEENFIRLPVTKAERQAKKNVFTVSNIGESLTSFGNNDFDGSGAGGRKRKRGNEGKGGKSKKKFKIKKKKFK